MAYIGVGPEFGKRVQEKDAFSYACERCLTGTGEERKQFMEIAKNSGNMLDFVGELVGWFYSGNWTHEVVGGERTGYIIRFSDSVIRSFYGTYLEALESAIEESDNKEIDFVVN